MLVTLREGSLCLHSNERIAVGEFVRTHPTQILSKTFEMAASEILGIDLGALPLKSW